jgi:hypothetical protein
MKLKIISALVFLLFSYTFGYVFVRQTYSEIWERSGNTYVIFPENKVLYYFFRPLSIVDERFTGIGSHIGQHRRN